jgi:hypothetical protein
MAAGRFSNRSKWIAPRRARPLALLALSLTSISCVPMSAAPRIAAPADAASATPGLAAAARPAATPSLARPAAYAFTGHTPLDALRARDCLAQAVYYEAGSQSEDGQRAVAQVVLNRVRNPAFPNSVCGVVYQGPMRAGGGCQFTFTCDGSLARAPARQWWDRAARVARSALAGSVYAPVGLATHYHTLQIHPYWADSLQTVGAIGAHRFYRWRGAAGQMAAFADLYRGGEPIAAPHPRQARPAADEADPLALARAYEAALPVNQATPAPIYSAEIEARGGDALFAASAGPASGQVREEYARSGQWLKQP